MFDRRLRNGSVNTALQTAAVVVKRA